MRVSQAIVVCFVAATLSLTVAAQEQMQEQKQKRITDVRLDAFAEDTQTSAENTPNDHVDVIWWIPQEYWAAAFAQDASLTPEARAALTAALSKYSMLAVVQADISALGQFSFYDRPKVAGALEIEVESPAGTLKLQPVEAVDAEVAPLIAVLSPLLTAAMGNLGANMHFFVLNDRSLSNPGALDRRVIDPYERNTIRVALKTSAGERLAALIETPVNALFVPRMCPDGRPAHVSWKFCPWNGERLR